MFMLAAKEQYRVGMETRRLLFICEIAVELCVSEMFVGDTMEDKN